MATAAIASGVGSILSGVLGGKGAKKAAQIQAQALNNAIGEQRRQYDQSRADFSPFLSGGTAALGKVSDLLGLSGTDTQQAAIDALKASPAFTSLYNTGQDTILQNAAATGGLRGGNTENSLAQFGSGLLATVIQNQLGNLGGLVNVGSGAAGNLGSLGANSANSISSLLAQQGAANANGVLGQTGAWQSAIGGLGSALGSYLGNNRGFTGSPW